MKHSQQKTASAMVQSAEPWTPLEAEHYRRTAQQCLKHSYKHDKPDPLNCGGCALRIGGASGPNYAGWQRIYVEANLTIPRKWQKAFFAAFTDKNQAFALALARSCKTFIPRFA